MHPVVLRRVVDTQLYGNDYPLDEVMSDLTDAIFAADAHSSVNAFRRNLQSEYVSRLGGMIKGSGSEAYDSSAQAMALFELERLADMAAARQSGDNLTRAHSRFVARKIEILLETGERS